VEISTFWCQQIPRQSVEIPLIAAGTNFPGDRAYLLWKFPHFDTMSVGGN
jgi:hypothetical protein